MKITAKQCKSNENVTNFVSDNLMKEFLKRQRLYRFHFFNTKTTFLREKKKNIYTNDGFLFVRNTLGSDIS